MVCNVPKVHLLTVSHMENTTIIVFSCVIAAVLTVSVLSTLVCVARIKGVEDRLDATVHEMMAKATPKQLENANAAAQSAQAIVQTTVQEISKFKDQIHGEMQRFYAIMNRNERALKKQETNHSPSEPESTPPDEVDAGSFEPQTPPGHEISKVELRAMARKAGL